nr:hypothetical protein [uncultured Allomuricauda sp.]
MRSLPQHIEKAADYKGHSPVFGKSDHKNDKANKEKASHDQYVI